MSGLQTTTTARRANPLALAAAVLCAGAGAGVLVGYALGLTAWVRMVPGSPPMRLNTAIAILCGGLSLLALARGWRRTAAACAAVPAVLGIETLVEYALGIPIQPWELALLKSIGAPVGASARPGALVGLCSALAGTGLLLMSAIVTFRRRLLAVGLLGSLLASAAGVAFVSYLVGMDTAFAASDFGKLGPNSALAFFVLGAAIVRYAWRDETSKRTGAPSWLPLLVAAGTLTVTVCLREAIVAEDRAQLRRKIEFDAAYLKSDLETQIENRIQPLIRLARRRSMAGQVTREEWQADVQGILGRGGYQAIQWVDAGERNVWATPPGAGDVLPDGVVAFEPRRREAFKSASESRAVAITRPVDLVTGGKGFLACVPAFTGEDLQGYAVGVFRYQLLFAGVLNLNVTSKYSLAIYDGPELVFGARQHKNLEWQREAAVPFHGASLRLQLAPGDTLVAEAASPVSGAVLVVGCLLAVLFALQTWLLQARAHPESAKALPAEGGMQALVQSSSLPVISYRPDGSVQAWNRAARELLGIAAPIRASAEAFRILRLTVLRGDGLREPPPVDENTHALRMLLDSSSLPAIAFDSQGVFQSCNPAATQSLGWTDAAWSGRRVGPIPADARAPFQACCVLLIQGHSAPGDAGAAPGSE